MITSAKRTGNDFSVTGNMMIKGVSREISFPCSKDGQTITATIPIDRTEFGIKYGSGSFFDNLGDNIIKDKFDLDVKLILK